MDALKPRPLQTLFGSKPGFAFLRLTLILAGFYAILHFVLMPTLVSGISMEPTFQDGEFTVVYRLAYRSHPPARHDIVAVQTPEDILLKRIIGLPGEKVEIAGGLVFINGAPLPEPYVKKRTNWNTSGQVLGPDEYLIIGDNRGMSQWRHTFGLAHKTNILGKVLF